MVTGLVLAAGGPRRLGRPKQLVPYGSATLLDHVLDTARACEFDQLLCVIGGEAEAVRAGVSLEGVEVVENQQFGEGCSSSIAAAIGALDERCEVLVLMLGDQPGVTSENVADCSRGATRHRSQRAATPTAADTRWQSHVASSPSFRRCTATRPSGSCSPVTRTRLSMFPSMAQFHRTSTLGRTTKRCKPANSAGDPPLGEAKIGVSCLSSWRTNG